jgi:DNA-binding transcriptional MocR family regulator
METKPVNLNEQPPQGLTQYQPVPGIIDLAWGHPDPTLLPIEELRAAAERALVGYGTQILAYGNPAGPPPLIDFICSRLRETDARAPSPAEVVITSGASQGIDLVASRLAPGDTALVDVPTYHLAIRILQDHPIHVKAIASDTDGIVLDDLARSVAELRQQGERPRLLYTIATFHNPTGRNMSPARRSDLITFARQENLLIAEDDTYRELSYDGPAPASLWALDETGTVIRIGSFAKSVAPGLRVGYLTAAPEVVASIATGGLLDSGGGTSHFAATVLADYAAAGDYVRQVERYRTAYRERRDRLLDSLAEHMPDGVSWSRPSGGFFVWIQLPEGVSAADVIPHAGASGLDFLPATAFFLDGHAAPNALRLAFSMYPPETLADAAARLATAITSAITTSGSPSSDQ